MTASPADKPTPQRPTRLTRRVLWAVVVAVVTGVTVFVATLAWPLIVPTPAGLSGQIAPVGYPTAVSATGQDGRVRTLEVRGPDGGEVALDALRQGDRVVVTGGGFHTRNGIYVAICAIPRSPDQRPGPCLGGVPDVDSVDGDQEASPQWAGANWINDDWAWKLFGARGFDDAKAGTFRAYLQVPPPADDAVDCLAVECGIYTRNDHTALDNRMQDLYLPVAFSR